ncbi:hypothetical protein MPSEU_000026500 [Mayamaea pseudoterrestris]|nr:hypothetical protein MPSEU_000026500 [Mayamaea pseudoterrestris]
MAWRSSGSNNDEMVSNLKRFGVIASPAVEEAFRAVDRRFFVPTNTRHLAHIDQPLREGNVHISAPHMYGAIVEALDLTPSSCTTFLNIGSGTGYLSCIVSHILGSASTTFGVDIDAQVLAHSTRAVDEWLDSRANGDKGLAQMEVVHGNGLCISSDQGEGAIGFDRIYVGAAIKKQSMNQLVELLKPGGIFVGPVEDELVKVHRIGRAKGSGGISVPRSINGHPPTLSADFSMRVVSSVRFFPLSEFPDMPVTLPTRVWSPDRHSLYPESFRKATTQILLCSHSKEVQPMVLAERQNVASKLPAFIWTEILSYTRRDWFEKAVPEEELLRKRLREEQARNQSHQERIGELESRVREVEREREAYRSLNARLRRRLLGTTNEASGSVLSDDANALAHVAPHVRLSDIMDIVVRRRLGQDDTDTASDEDDSGEDETQEGENYDMDGDTVMSTESAAAAVNDSIGIGRPQVRSVSISTDD